MKRIPCTIVVLLFLAFTVRAQNNVGINDNSSSPKASAMLDVYSTTKGMLIPRIALTSTSSASPVTSPETSLLIYNTATTGDVTPGYYYWNASKWVRLRAGTDPAQTINTVTKSANATLLKTENMVFASGDITLTLPVITSTDDGLEITVKNTGAYTDLVTIAPQSTHTIDAVTSVGLTRWKGRTFVARNSNWIVKEKDTRTDNFLDIGKDASFTTIAEAIAFLNEHMSGPTVIRVGGGNYTISSTVTINLPYPVTIEGISYGEAFITGTSSGSVMFDCQTETYIKMLAIRGAGTGTGTDAIHLSGTDEYYEMTDVTINNFDKGIVHTASNESWIFNASFDTIATSGVEIAAGTASDGITNVSETDFSNCGKGINLLSGAAWTFAATNCNFYNETGSQYGIYYNPTNFTNFSFMSISNNGWNNTGTFMYGFDFSRTDGRDANAYIQNNLGMENKNPHFRLNVLNNASTVTVSTANTWYKANWTTTSSVPCSWLCVNNKVTYLPVNKRDVAMWISGNMSVNNSSRTLGIAIVKNGVTSTRYGETTLRTASSSSNQPYQFSTVIYVEDVSPGDYFELYLTSTTSGDVVKVIDLNWYSDSK